MSWTGGPESGRARSVHVLLDLENVTYLLTAEAVLLKIWVVIRHGLRRGLSSGKLGPLYAAI